MESASAMSTCSVIMLSHFSGGTLIPAVKSVLRQKQLAELVLIDQGNPPNSLSRLQQIALGEPKLKIISAGNVHDLPKGYNLGASHATGNILLFISDHMLLAPDALTQAMKVLADTNRAVIVAPLVQEADRKEASYSRPALPSPRHVLLKPAPLPKGDLVDQSEVEAASSHCMWISKEHFQKLQGFDEYYGNQAHAFDLAMRVTKQGGKIIFVPKIKVTALPKSLVAATGWQDTKSLMRYFKRHYSNNHALPVLWAVNATLAINFASKRLKNKMRSSLREAPMTRSVATKRLMILASGLSDLPEKKELQGKAVLVTGATSQVGLCVVKRLIASGAAVLAVSRGDAIPFRHEHLRWIKGDLTDETFHLHGYLVDMAIHCAPLWHLPPTLDVLADADVKRVIALGSTSIFAKALSRNVFEHEIVERLTRAEAELSTICKRRGMSWTLLRPTMIYGVGLDENITYLAKFIDRFGFAPVYPPAFGKRQPVHADDVAIAVMQLLANDTTIDKAYNISGGEVVTYREMCERLFPIVRQKPRIIETTMLPGLLDIAGKIMRKDYINGEIARRMNDDLVFFHDDARRDFGFSPRPFLSGGMKDIEGV